MKVIVGLGNPGKHYEKTYHNIGFLTLDALAKALGAKFSKKMGKSEVAEVFYLGQKVLLVKPQTFMNLSGEAVLAIKSKFKLEDKDFLVVLDDIDLPIGKIRYRTEGSGGTHNGLKNIIALLKNNQISRLRLGVGKDDRMDLADFVLSKIKDSDMVELEKAILESVDFIMEEFLSS